MESPQVDEARILQFMTTEHLTLQSARASTVVDANGRITMYFGAISSTVVALAFIGDAVAMGDTFFLFSLILLPPLFFMGVVTFRRVLDVMIADMVYARGINRIRHYYVELAPQLQPYFIESVHDDMQGIARSMGVAPSRWQHLLTSSGLVSVVNAVIGGVFVGLLSARFAAAPPAVAIGLGIFSFAIALALHMRHQVRRWTRAEAQFEVVFPSDAP